MRKAARCRRRGIPFATASIWMGWMAAMLFTGFIQSVAMGQKETSQVQTNLPDSVVTVNADDAEISDVLQAFSMQTGISIVIGPEVAGNVTMRLTDVPWQEALDIILKPYGYGYRMVGATVVVNNREKILEAAAIEPVLSRVFNLKYLDAGDTKEIITDQLSSRGKLSILTVRGQKGWEFESGSGGGRNQTASAAALGKRQRLEEDEEVIRSKTIIVADVKDVLDRIDQILEKIDVRPQQILIQAKFMEVGSDKLQDIGVEFGVGGTTRDGADVYEFNVQQTGDGVQPASFNANSTSLNATDPFNAGLAFAFQRLTDVQYNIMLHALEEKAGANVLSAPRILTLNNQEATIIVGTKFPIIRSEVSGESATISTALEYYENIGIQLNVVPQICDGGFINMIVHPAVTDQIGTASARTGTGSDIPLTEFPILSTREAETQILLKSGNTIVIGGLLEDQETKTVLKVPILGDIPLLGRLFRRETTDNNKTDLLIFLTGTILPAGEPVVTPHVDVQDLEDLNQPVLRNFNRTRPKGIEIEP